MVGSVAYQGVTFVIRNAVRFTLKLDRNTENMFTICFRRHRDEKKGKQLLNFDYQKANSLCSCHHYVNSSC